MEIAERIRLIQAARGEIPLDLVIQNVKLVNVYSGQIQAAEIGIIDGRVATLNAGDASAAEVIDAGGMFAIPGLIDTHVHIDSTLLTPEHLAEVIVPHGTTCMLTDPMEISNVAGKDGLAALVRTATDLPFHFFVEVSSRVPTAPGLETTGGTLGLAEVSEVLTWPEAVSLGELDPSKVLGLKEEYLAKVERAIALGKICNGHTAGLSGADLAAYVCGGLSDDHECVDYDDAISRLRSGLSVLIREGSSERNLDGIVRGALAAGIDFSNLMFCTDDKHPDDIQTEGHIDYMVNRAIQLGVKPVTAIQMATINAARHFRIDHLVGSITPGRWADIILTPALERIECRQVLVRGKQVAASGHLLTEPQTAPYPRELYSTFHVSRGKSAADFDLPAEGAEANVWVIDLVRDQIINRRSQASLRVGENSVQVDLEQDILKLAVVERYGQNGGIGISFVRGFGLKRGAMASSVSHDHHNIVVAGTNDDDMARCVAEIEAMQGGLVFVTDGYVLARLPLPIAGLMSDKSSAAVIEELNILNDAYHVMGGGLAAPFMTLSFISLPTVPDLGLTDKGLVDVFTHQLISPFVGE